MVASTAGDWLTILGTLGVLLAVAAVCGKLADKVLPHTPRLDPVWDEPASSRRTLMWDLMDEGGIDGEPCEADFAAGTPLGGSRYMPDTRDENSADL